MKEHLTEQQLIDYAFELAGEVAMGEVRSHLKQCRACRDHLAQLKTRFTTLDLLREEIQASPELVAKTVSGATRSKRPAILTLWRYPWLAAAAMFVLGVSLLLIPRLGSNNPQEQVGPESSNELTAKRLETTEDDVRALGSGGQERTFSAVPQTLVPAEERPEKTQVPATPTLVAAASVLAEAIDEKPPFAPASAIELVVLPRRENVQLTIYNSADLTLVRERRSLTLKKGWNWLQFMWAGTLIDPTSLTLEPVQHKDKVDVQQLVFPPRLRALGRWLIRSEISGQVPFELTYLTSGLSWRAFYIGTLSQDEKTMHLQGHVRVDNHSGEDYENAQTRLVVGKVHLLDQIRELAQREYAYGSPFPLGRRAGMGGGMMGGMGGVEDEKVLVLGDMPTVGGLFEYKLGRKEIRKEGLSEYFLYTIEGTETIPDQWGKRLLSFEANDVPVTSLYKYDQERWGGQAIRFVSFANDQEHNLGDTPIPDGTVRIYGQVDTEAHLSYVGAANIKYIPVGEEVELNLGPARLVKVEPTLMETRTENYVFDANDNIIGWDQLRTVKTEVTNARTVPVDIEITQPFGTPYWELKVIEGVVAYEKHDVTHARFELTVPPKSKQVFTYTDRTYHGVREEVFIKK